MKGPEAKVIPGLEIVTEEASQNITIRLGKPIKSLSHLPKPTRRFLEGLRPGRKTRVSLTFSDDRVCTHEITSDHLIDIEPPKYRRSILGLARAVLADARTPDRTPPTISSPLSEVKILLLQ